MATSPLRIDQASFNRQIAEFTKKVGKAQKEVDAWTINAIAKKAVSNAAKQVQANHGYKQSTIKKQIKIKPRAKPRSLSTKITAKGRRLPWPGRRAIKRKKRAIGVSYLGEGKKRVNITTTINGGSIPFMFRGQYSNADLIGYRSAGHKKKLLAFTGHSVPHMLGQDWEETTRRWVIREYPKERGKQQKRHDYLKQSKRR